MHAANFEFFATLFILKAYRAFPFFSSAINNHCLKNIRDNRYLHNHFYILLYNFLYKVFYNLTGMLYYILNNSHPYTNYHRYHYKQYHIHKHNQHNNS